MKGSLIALKEMVSFFGKTSLWFFMVANRYDTKMKCTWLILIFLLVSSVQINGQQTTLITGVVVDFNGKQAEGATVALLDSLGFTIATINVDDTGHFVFKEVPLGTYSVVADRPPYRSIAKLIALETPLPIDLKLHLLPETTETVLVERPIAPPGTMRTTLSGEMLRHTPARLQSRGLSRVLSTLPGFSSEDNGLLHVRGMDDGFLYVEDGVPIYDRIDTLFGVAPDPASIETIQVLTGYIPPEFGLKSGAVIEVQTALPKNSEWFADLGFGFGGDNSQSLRSTAAGPLGKNLSLGISVAMERSQRFLDPVHPKNFHNKGNVLSGNIKFSLPVSTNNLVKLNMNNGRSRYQVPHGKAQEESGQNQRQRLAQNSQSLSWQRSWSNNTVSQISVYRRSVGTTLLGSQNDIPVTVNSERSHRRVGVIANITHQQGSHTFKIGFETARLAIFENFIFGITDLSDTSEIDISESAKQFTIARPFYFQDRNVSKHLSIYAQNIFHVSNQLTLNFGVRFDRTNLLIPASQWSPRLGLSYRVHKTGTTFRASINRLFQPPQSEHLLLSSSEEARALSPFTTVENNKEGQSVSVNYEGGAQIKPERQTAWEFGFEQWLGTAVRLDGAYWRRNVKNYADPNVFLGTTIIFPNSVAHGHASGFDFRLEVSHYRAFSSYISYTNATVTQFGPINGGLFLEDSMIEIGPGTQFTPDHDQRHVGSAGLIYTHNRTGFTTSLSARYESGTPLEVDFEKIDKLLTRTGIERVDIERGRMRPRMLFDVVIAKPIWNLQHTKTSARLSILNLTNASYALNFGNPFSGTHFGAPRTIIIELNMQLQ